MMSSIACFPKAKHEGNKFVSQLDDANWSTCGEGATDEAIAKYWCVLRQNLPEKRSIYMLDAAAPSIYIVRMNIQVEKIGLLEFSVDSCLENGDRLVHVGIKAPDAPAKRDPVAIICVLDISGSMDCEATQSGGESDGFTRLDLVKHSVNTIINTLEGDDVLGIVTFSNQARIDFALANMNEEGRNKAMKVVSDMKTEGATNLWDGMHKGMELSKDEKCLTRNTFVVVLSDGEPNQHPPNGEWGATMEYIQSNPLRCSMSMFGYGYNLDTNLLGALTELGGGFFGFIPDCSMIGTIFVNFLSSALSTFSPKVSLALDSHDGKFVDFNGQTEYTANLGAIQYGTTRHCVFRFKEDAQAETLGNLSIQLGSELRAVKTIKLDNVSAGSKDTIEVQGFRFEHIRLLKKSIQEADKSLPELLAQFQQHAARMKAHLKNGEPNELLDGLIRDITSDLEREGQISIALSSLQFWKKWGLHYFHALKIAHSIETCTNFKDPGLQSYGGPLFKSLQDSIDTIFIKLPPPQPSIQKYDNSGNLKQVYSMDNYYDIGGGCIHGDCKAKMADGTIKRVAELKKGDCIRGSNGAAKILCVIETPIEGVTNMVQLEGGLIITGYHPIFINGEWKFPSSIAPSVPVYTDSYFNFVLEDGHSVQVNGVQCISLGHGLKGDVVAEHAYFGSERVIEDLKSMEGWSNGEIKLGRESFKRNAVTKMVEGIKISI